MKASEDRPSVSELVWLQTGAKFLDHSLSTWHWGAQPSLVSPLTQFP